jgi:glutamate racemase
VSCPRILVFDSGIGGLSICQQLIASPSAVQLNYLSDNAAFPYGEKTAAEVIERACEVVEKAYRRLQPELVVIACNTASTVVLPSLRARLTVPVVGVVPAIKTAAQISKTQTFGLLATPGTVSRVYTAKLIAKYASQCRVVSVGSSKLVREAEQYMYGNPLNPLVLDDIINSFEQHQYASTIDTVVLGCTHFPLLKQQLQALKPNWQWIDSGAAIAARAFSLLDINAPQNNTAPVSHNFYYTLKNSNQSPLMPFIKAMNFGSAVFFE